MNGDIGKGTEKKERKAESRKLKIRKRWKKEGGKDERKVEWIWNEIYREKMRINVNRERKIEMQNMGDRKGEKCGMREEEKEFGKRKR